MNLWLVLALHKSVLMGLLAQLRDDLMTMLIAGHETTAAVLTWATYYLAQVEFLFLLYLIFCFHDNHYVLV